MLGGTKKDERCRGESILTLAVVPNYLCVILAQVQGRGAGSWCLERSVSHTICGKRRNAGSI